MDPKLLDQINEIPFELAVTSGDKESDVQQDALFKVIIIGDTGVGKSCMLARLISQVFKEEHNVTIGVEFGNFGMVMRGKTHVKLQIWDTAGQESFRSITRIFYKGSHAVFIVFDITNRKSFESVKEWQKEIENNADADVIKYLVGNFADMEDEREVSPEDAVALMKELDFQHYIETSALTGQNINSLFETVTKHLFMLNEFKLHRFVSPTGRLSPIKSYSFKF